MNQTIIGLAGRKSSGKNTFANFMVGAYMVGLGISRSFNILEDGQLYISDIDEIENTDGIFDYYRQTASIDEFKKNRLDPFIKLYSFADLLKKNVCMNILGLSYEQCYGTNEQKNQLTDLLWEDMPGVITEVYVKNVEITNITGNYENGDLITPMECQYEHYYHSSGQMTAREVLQHVGTNIFRKMSGNVWVSALFRQIQKDNAKVVIITDCRFPNEVYGIQDRGGKVVYLTRNPYNDTHASETALDKENFDHSKFAHILQNDKMTIDQQNSEVCQLMLKWGILPKELETKKL